MLAIYQFTRELQNATCDAIVDSLTGRESHLMALNIASLKRALQALVRKRAPIVFGDISRFEPASREFGLERGTAIDRYYIDAFIAANADAIVGRALEVGELRYLNRFGDRTSEKCVLAPARAIVKDDPALSRAVIGDLTDLTTLPIGAFDVFVCTQTLNFIFDVRGAIRGAHHVLAPGGTFVGTVAGISQISRYDMDRWGDFWRFTTLAMTKLIGEVFGSGNVRVEAWGNALTAQMFLQGLAVEDVPNRALLDRRDDDYQLVIGFRARKVA